MNDTVVIDGECGLFFGLQGNGEDVNNRVVSLDETEFVGDVINVYNVPIYIDAEHLQNYSAYGISEKGWYIFARISSKGAIKVTDETSISGDSGHIMQVGNNFVDVAIMFEVASMSKKITVTWNSNCVESFIFNATDLAIRNLNYRVTFFVYDLDDFATYTYVLTTDTVFAAGKKYYTFDESNGYVLAEVTVGETIPANTYYKHSKVSFSGMSKNITYRFNQIIDCPIEIVLPEIPDDGYGAWFELHFRHDATYSTTLVPPEGTKIATDNAVAQSVGLNVLDLHYSCVAGAKVWRLVNTHSSFAA